MSMKLKNQAHLSHEGRFSTHVRPRYKNTGGAAFHLAALTVPRATDEDVVWNEVIPKKSFGHAGVTGSDELDEGSAVVVVLWKNHPGSAHGPISAQTVAEQSQQHIWRGDAQNETKSYAYNQLHILSSTVFQQVSDFMGSSFLLKRAARF